MSVGTPQQHSRADLSGHRTMPLPPPSCFVRPPRDFQADFRQGPQGAPRCEPPTPPVNLPRTKVVVRRPEEKGNSSAKDGGHESILSRVFNVSSPCRNGNGDLSSGQAF